MIRVMFLKCVCLLLLGWRCKAQNPPVMTATAVVALYEDTTSDTTVSNVQCTDVDGDTVVVSGSISPTTRCGSCFVVVPIGSSSNNYELTYFPAVASLDFNVVAEYTVTLTCTDGTDSVTEDVIVRLLPNSPPTFDDGLSVTTSFSSVKTTTAGTVLYTVSATDPNGDAITYTMTTNPASDNFQIGLNDGMITAANDLVSECNNVISFSVLISDGKISNVGPQTIAVTLIDANVAPTITNLDATGTVAEDATVGESLFSLFTSDDDASPTVSMTTNPANAISFFTLSGTQLQVAQALDYENVQIRTTSIRLVADDGACTSRTYTYTLSITDVNEAPLLQLSSNPQEIYEGDVSQDPGWTVNDDDAGDTHIFTITETTPNNSPFSIDSTTGLITSTTNYDIDQGANTATVTLTVQVADAAGLTDTVEYIMHFKDTNDNYPAFTSGTQNLFFTITECATIGSSLGAFSATDDDSDFQNNNVLEFTEVDTSTGGITIAPSGDVILNTAISAGTSVTLNVQVTDKGEHPNALTSLVGGTITVTSTACPSTTSAATTTGATAAAATTTTTTTQAPNTSSEADSVWWIAVAALLGTIFLGLTAFLCLTRIPLFCRFATQGHWLKNPICNCNGQMDMCKRRRRPKKVQVKNIPAKEKPRAPPDNGNDGFWQEHFQEDPFKRQPDRDALPEPVNMEAGPHREALPWRSSPSPFTVGGKDNGRVWNTNIDNNRYGDGDGDGIL